MTTTTAVPATIDPEVLTRLELALAGGDLPAECELCEARPTWWFITRPCGCRHALCGTHLDVSSRKYLLVARGLATGRCLACLVSVDAVTTEPLR